MEKNQERVSEAVIASALPNKSSTKDEVTKKLYPKFEPLSTLYLKQSVDELARKKEPVEHRAILGELLKSIQPFDFEKAAFPQVKELREKYTELKSEFIITDGTDKPVTANETRSEIKDIEKQLSSFKVTKKHFAILSIENVLHVAEQMKWGICKNNDFIYLYNGEFWAHIEKEAFQIFLGEAAEKMGVTRFESRWYEFRDTLFKQFIATSYLPKPIQNKDTVLINLKNGTFEISPTGQKLRGFDRADFLTYQLPFPYDPEARSPLFDAYLDQVQPDPLRQSILAEYLGSVFVPVSHLKLEKALILYGGGANGKSVFFDIVNALFGDANVSGYSLESLTDKDGYFRAMIVNKLLNYASELNANQATTDKTKQLISGEKIQARLPYGQPFDMTDYAKLMFNCNELPRNAEQTNAYFRRFLIIDFEQTIPEHEQDKELSKKIIATELSGVFNWVLEGLNRLLNQKKFSKCDAAQNVLEQYKAESNSVQLFLNENEYKSSPTNYKLIKDLYPEYRSFCIDDGAKPFQKKNFTKQLRTLGFVVDRVSQNQLAVFIE